jgi:hypothetical protein
MRRYENAVDLKRRGLQTRLARQVQGPKQAEARDIRPVDLLEVTVVALATYPPWLTQLVAHAASFRSSAAAYLDSEIADAHPTSAASTTLRCRISLLFFHGPDSFLAVGVSGNS